MSPEDEKKLAATEIACEADSYASLMLWREHHDKPYDGKPWPWVQDNRGFWTTVGTLGKNKPVCVSFFWADVKGKRVLFYECTSRYADHTMIEKFIKKHAPRATFIDCMNFHNAFY